MKQSKDYSWLLYVIIIAIAVLASSCGTTDVKYKGKVIGSSVTQIVSAEPGFAVGDTILIRNYGNPKFIIQSIIK